MQVGILCKSARNTSRHSTTVQEFKGAPVTCTTRQVIAELSTLKNEAGLTENLPNDRREIGHLLQGCNFLPLGKRLHYHISRTGLEHDTFLGNLLVSMYGKCGSVEDARSVFDNMQQRDVVSWNAIITVYAEQDYCKQALCLFRQMQQEDIDPNSVTYLCALNACGNIATIKRAQEIHAAIIISGLESLVAVATAIISTYGKCGEINAARCEFERKHICNVIYWTAMVTAYARQCYCKEALELFWQMHQKSMNLDCVTFVSALSACANLAAIGEGHVIHFCMIDRGLESNPVLQNALLSMYGKCGAMDEACFIFMRMHQHDVVSFSVMIASYAEHCLAEKAIQLFKQMQQEAVKPNKITLINFLNACALQEGLAEGVAIHACIADTVLEADVVVGTAIVTMYGKCGTIVDAHRVFNKIHDRNVASWNAMITVYVEHMHSRKALELFQQMQQECVKPDSITFINILSASANLAALPEGAAIHAWIIDSGLEFNVILRTCLIIMYGKCGSVADAFCTFNEMHPHDVTLWNSMMAAHGQQGNGKEALQLFQKMEEEKIKPDTATFTSLLSACSHAGMVDEGCWCFYSSSKDHGISPTVEHYGCLADLFGRAGCLDEVENLIYEMPIQSNAFVWTALLNTCKMHVDARQGMLSAKQIIDLDPQNAATYIVLSSIQTAAKEKWTDEDNTRKTTPGKL